MNSKEQQRLNNNYREDGDWLKWGPYLSERQWGTVREDYSPDGEVWKYFKHKDARSRAYRWGEDGIAGICDRYCNICFGVALWNGKDEIIKERLFGLSGPEGNHGEDVKELYYYLDNTPTHSYMKHLYKYPQAAYPYQDLIMTNAQRSKQEPEYEILDTGIFDSNDYFDVFTEYAKDSETDLCIKITVHNRGKETAPLTVLPTLWLRNLWSFGLIEEKPNIEVLEGNDGYGVVKVSHQFMGEYYLYFDTPDRLLFTENDTNEQVVYNQPNKSAFVKDAINDAVVSDNFDIFENKKNGTKCSPLFKYEIEGEDHVEICLRLTKDPKEGNPLAEDLEQIFAARIAEADEFYENIVPAKADDDEKNIHRQALAGMLWTKQYYNMDVSRWLKGDPGQVPPPPSRKKGRNSNWQSLINNDIISMPDKWEFPWYAAWDLAFHCVPLAMVDAQFAKNQLILFLREWYMRPSGQIPAYEWAFGDVNPPVHAWACLRVYHIDKAQTGTGDIDFLKRAFQKLLINFTWWINRTDEDENNVFEGGFLGLDNIGVFDRSKGVPVNGQLEQADGTSWMAMYCLNMLDMALEIAQVDKTFQDVATKFLQHFVIIAASLNQISEDYPGAWDEEEGFFYDILTFKNGDFVPLKIRSLVGLTTMFATLVLDKERLKNVPDFVHQIEKFRNYRRENGYFNIIENFQKGEDVLLSLIPKNRLERILKTLLDEEEFLSEGGIRSLSKIHQNPYRVNIRGRHFSLQYEPAESTTNLFGGNSNWRGPVWFPMNYLLLESLQKFHQYYGDNLQTECPYGSGNVVNLQAVATELSDRLVAIFKKNDSGKRPVHGKDSKYQNDPHFQELVLFYEHFHGDNGRGVGASHQTGWTGLVADLIK